MIKKCICFDGEKNVRQHRLEDTEEKFFRISEHSKKAMTSKKIEAVIRKIRYLFVR
ncbi:hypothetical protein [Pseudobutyrivibrio sp. MD2005]|uniref:hypothetical protein n=1 Tax=Pseudobutyrivibrio sp. MD2005 TaxID=1410616 RepID=UPI0012DDEBB7|nr:hypothetical protein [Pseudobutyrivibrio sp. MD2005]